MVSFTEYSENMENSEILKFVVILKFPFFSNIAIRENLIALRNLRERNKNVCNLRHGR